jgi:peptidoglycan/xylan/chitin deacetylase (PgdA/CDA1 family)
MAWNSNIIFRSRVRAYLACGAYLCARLLLPFLSHRHRGKTRVVVFHHIDDEKVFSKIVRAIARRYNLISFEEYLQGKQSESRINVIIALDDGYRSWFTNGRPVFTRYWVQPLLFVSSDYIGLEETRAMRFCRESIKTWPEPSLTWPDLELLAQEGAEVGGHALGHSNLLLADKAELVQKLKVDRETIEQKSGTKVRSFSYPFGLYDDDVAFLVKTAGYQYAFTSDSGFLEDSRNSFLLKRTNIGQRPPLVVEAFIEGWADWISDVVRWIKRKKR